LTELKSRGEQATAEALYRSFNFEALILHPHDYLGHCLAERRSKGWNPNAYYPTPHSVCDAMAMMVFEGDERVYQRVIAELWRKIRA
jgi:hypothetical protein